MSSGSLLTFDRYLNGLVGSWAALAAPQRGASVTWGDGFAIARFPHPVLNNAVLLDTSRRDLVIDSYAGLSQFAIWTVSTHAAAAEAMKAVGFRRDQATEPMVLDLAGWRPDGTQPPVAMRDHANADDVSALNGTAPDLLRRVPGLRAFLTDSGDSGLVTIDVDDDVNISWVSTKPKARGQGLASAALEFALGDAVSRGMRTATLQATKMAAGLYARAGFVTVGHWHEWVR